jgi:hypothetical protein
MARGHVGPHTRPLIRGCRAFGVARPGPTTGRGCRILPDRDGRRADRWPLLRGRSPGLGGHTPSLPAIMPGRGVGRKPQLGSRSSTAAISSSWSSCMASPPALRSSFPTPCAPASCAASSGPGSRLPQSISTSRAGTPACGAGNGQILRIRPGPRRPWVAPSLETLFPPFSGLLTADVNSPTVSVVLRATPTSGRLATAAAELRPDPPRPECDELCSACIMTPATPRGMPPMSAS